MQILRAWLLLFKVLLLFKLLFKLLLLQRVASCSYLLVAGRVRVHTHVCVCVCVFVFVCRSNGDGVLDVAFDCTGQLFATACADGAVKVFDTATQALVAQMDGHEADVVKVIEHKQQLAPL